MWFSALRTPTKISYFLYSLLKAWINNLSSSSLGSFSWRCFWELLLGVEARRRGENKSIEEWRSFDQKQRAGTWLIPAHILWLLHPWLGSSDSCSRKSVSFFFFFFFFVFFNESRNPRWELKQDLPLKRNDCRYFSTRFGSFAAEVRQYILDNGASLSFFVFPRIFFHIKKK